MTIPAMVAPSSSRSGSAAPARLLIVSNRLPMTMRVQQGAVRVQRSSGGLATGLRGVHADTGGLWIGWPGLSTEQAGTLWPEMQRHLAAAGAAGVPLSRQELDGFYSRYSNGALWPVLHDRLDHPAPDDEAWSLYRAVNERYADAVVERLRPGDRVWVHDYQLMLVPRLVRDRCPHARIGFFLHTPFPDPASFATLPHATALLEGLLGADVVGLPHSTPMRAGSSTRSASSCIGQVRGDDVFLGPRRAHVCAFPMGIDVASFDACATDPAVRAEAQRLARHQWRRPVPRRGPARLHQGNHRATARLRAAAHAQPPSGGAASSFRSSPCRRARTCARTARLRGRVERVVNRINGAFARPELDSRGIPLRLGGHAGAGRALPRGGRHARDAAPRRDESRRQGVRRLALGLLGTLVLGERAGAAEELRSSLLVDPPTPTRSCVPIAPHSACPQRSNESDARTAANRGRQRRVPLGVGISRDPGLEDERRRKLALRLG